MQGKEGPNESCPANHFKFEAHISQIQIHSCTWCTNFHIARIRKHVKIYRAINHLDVKQTKPLEKEKGYLTYNHSYPPKRLKKVSISTNTYKMKNTNKAI